MTLHYLKLSLMVSSLLLTINSYAADAPPASPPPEAIEACSSSTEGSSCSVETPDGTLTGSCIVVETQELACVPESDGDLASPDDTGTTGNNESTGSTDTSQNTTSENSSTSNPATNSMASYDSSSATLNLPIVSIGNELYYQVSLKVVAADPILLELTEAIPTTSTTPVSATYDGSTEVLSIPSLSLNSKLYSADLKRDSSLSGYQFELQSLLEITATYPIVDTGQSNCYNSGGTSINCSGSGQDGAYSVNQPSYANNGDGTITDNVSGLVWQSTTDTNADGTINSSDRLSLSAAESYCSNLVLGNQSDWRLPNIKQLYSLINFNGEDVSGVETEDTSSLVPFIDTNYFAFAYGDTSAGDRIIDVQYASSTLYVSDSANGNQSLFGVNMADGRIKAYGVISNGSEKSFTTQCVRGSESYGINSFTDNSDATISDSASGLMWEKNDSPTAMDWDAAINYCETGSTGGYSDWRLPNVKELQRVVDYTRSPDSSNSAAIDALFSATSFTNEAGQTDWGFYWSSTTHKKSNGLGDSAAYVSFGRALGYMNEQWLDVHGAGAQRSAPKVSSSQQDPAYVIVTDANGNEAITHGPQGDVVRTNNYVRCVR